MMANWRSNPPQTIGGQPVARLLDYENQVEKDLRAGTQKPIDMPKSDVLQFYTADGTKISARPSGTEPKIKFYFSVNTTLADKAQYEAAEAQQLAKIKAIVAEMGLQ
jgi:phosphoglucomutase